MLGAKPVPKFDRAPFFSRFGAGFLAEKKCAANAHQKPRIRVEQKSFQLSLPIFVVTDLVERRDDPLDFLLEVEVGHRPSSDHANGEGLQERVYLCGIVFHGVVSPSG